MTTFGRMLDLAVLTIYDENDDQIFEYVPREPDVNNRDWIVQCVDLKPDQTLFVVQAAVRPREGETLFYSTTTLDNFEVDLGNCIGEGWSN